MSWVDALQSAGDHATRIEHDLPYFSQYLKIRPEGWQPGTLRPQYGSAQAAPADRGPEGPNGAGARDRS